MRALSCLVVALLAVVVLVGTAHAQPALAAPFTLSAPEGLQTNIVNPTRVEFESVDHALAVRYELGYYLPGAVDPHMVVVLPLTEITGGPTYSALLAKPLLGIDLTLRARVVATAAAGGEVKSPWSDATDPFDLTPLAPFVRVRR